MPPRIQRSKCLFIHLKCPFSDPCQDLTTQSIPLLSQCLQPKSSRSQPRPLHQHQQSRTFSSSKPLPTRLRRDFLRWMNGPGRAFKDPLPGSTNYINAYDRSGGLIREGGKRVWMNKQASEDTDGSKPSGPSKISKEQAEDLMPFPMNRFFRSQPVLSESLAEEIYRRILEEKQDVRNVSVALGVEMSRVAAVVRMKVIEKQWEKGGKRLALPYARAIKAMLPQTPYSPRAERVTFHEPINDLPVHRATAKQIFHPTSESRQFTRADAGELFQRGLLPADERIPHPQLIQAQKLADEGLPQDQIKRLQRSKDEEAWRVWQEEEQKRREKEEKDVTRVEAKRWEFRFKNVAVDVLAGSDGRGRNGIGQRYGVPHQDRQRGLIKIPTSVE